MKTIKVSQLLTKRISRLHTEFHRLRNSNHTMTTDFLNGMETLLADLMKITKPEYGSSSDNSIEQLSAYISYHTNIRLPEKKKYEVPPSLINTIVE